jgi:hypothetical protein
MSGLHDLLKIRPFFSINVIRLEPQLNALVHGGGFSCARV